MNRRRLKLAGKLDIDISEKSETLIRDSSVHLSLTGRRPPSMSDEIINGLPLLIADGVSDTVACKSIGISYGTFRRWMREGQLELATGEPVNPWQYHFRLNIIKATGERDALIERKVHRISNHGKETKIYKYRPQLDDDGEPVLDENGQPVIIRYLDRTVIEDDGATAKWLLERRMPEIWGRRDRVEHTGADGGPIQTANVHLNLDAHYDKLSLDLRKRMLQEIGDDGQGQLSSRTRIDMMNELLDGGVDPFADDTVDTADADNVIEVDSKPSVTTLDLSVRPGKLKTV